MTIVVKVSLSVDHSGMVTRQCLSKKCKKIFKIKMDDHIKFEKKVIRCPYCGKGGDPVMMNTDEQVQQIALKERDKLLDAEEEFKKMEAGSDPDSVILYDSPHRHKKQQEEKPVEKELKKTVCCKKCNKPIAVDFEPSFCPFCKPGRFSYNTRSKFSTVSNS